MLPIKALLSTAILASTALASATNQVALYWGQNSVGLAETDGGQERLAAYCDNTDVDIILLSFLNFFPDPLNVNFANQCGDTFSSGLLHCQRIGEDIKTCQSKGKKVLLSMGGAAGNYGFQTTGSATEFATTLWNKFGAGEDDERPFDDAIIDGFDFDIELPNEDGKSVGYPELATALRSKFSEDSSKQYYLSAAPQCPYPDALLKDLMNQVPLDFAFIQFYNNECSIDQEFNYDTWQTFAETAPNSDIQLFVGVPATSNIAGYVDAEQLSTAIDQIKCDANFAGVSLWDASGAWSNVNDEGENFAAQVKKVLNDNVCEAPSSSSVEEESTSTAEEESTTEKPTEESTTEEPTVESTTLPSSTAHYYGNSTVSSTQSSTKVSSSSSTVVSSSATKAPGSGNGLITVTDIHKTVVTVTSCSEDKCHATPVTTGYVVVTDLHTVYTTYCPLTNSEVVVPVESTTIRSTSISTVPCTTSTGTQEGNKDVVTKSATTSCEETETAEQPKTLAGETTTITTTKEGHIETVTGTTECSTSTSAPAPAENETEKEHQKEQPETTSAPAVIVSSSSGVVVSSTVVPAGEESGETVYSTIEITSTIVPYPVPTTVTYSSNNGTQPAGNGTVPVFTYEGAGVVNTINNAWYTLPLLLVALAF